MSDWPSVTFAPGTRVACVKGMTWLLIDCPPTHPVVLEAWATIDRGGSVDEIVGALLARGMAEAPDFGLAATTGPAEVRFVLRGAVGASLVSDSEADELVAHGILSDQNVSGLEGFVLHGAEGRGIANLPVVAGIIPVNHLSVALPLSDRSGAQSPVPVEADRSAEVPVMPEPEPESELDLNPDSDPNPEPESEPDLKPDPEPELAGTATDVEPEVVPVEDPKVLASIREYERLFGSLQMAPTKAGPSPADQDEIETPPVAATLPEEIPQESGTAMQSAADETPELPELPGIPVSAEPPRAVQTASPGGFIDAVPDFLGPSVGITPPTTGAPTTASVQAPSTPAPSDLPPSTPTPSPAPLEHRAPQGRTVNRAHLHASALADGPTVWAARCPAGHPSQAFAANCRVCGALILTQEPAEISRPILGRLVIPGSASIPLDGDLVLGRDPRVPADSTTAPRLVVINDPRMEVSSQHASITLNFWDVCLTDLGSTNGTEVIDRDGRRQRLAQNSTITIQPGTKIILAEVVEITFEVSE